MDLREKIATQFIEPDEKDMVLLEEKISKDFKCGNCNTNLVIRVYYKNRKYYKLITCPNCGFKLWRDV